MIVRIENDCDENGNIVLIECTKCHKKFSKRGIITHHAKRHWLDD